MRDELIRDGHATEAPMRAPDMDRRTPAGELSAFNFENRPEDTSRLHEPAGRQEDSLRDRPAAARREEQSLPDLLRELAHQGSHLAEQQTRLVEAEVRSAVTNLEESIGAMAGAGVVGIAGLGVLLMGISFLLGTVMPLWLATMIVAVATLVGAYAMFAAGKGKLKSKPLTLDRTRHTLERAPKAISGNEKDISNGR